MGLYSTTNNGSAWTSIAGGFPANSFVYALKASDSMIFAGTSAGVYKSIDNGVNWTSSNTGFPASMWAADFAIMPGYIFAGTYSEGVFVSTDNGNNWVQKNNGIPDLPFPTGLPHNYPTIQSLIISGTHVLAATVNGMYVSSDNGNNWSETDQGILATDITAITTNQTAVFAGAARTGMFVSTNNGTSWTRSNNGLTSYDVLALATKGSSVFVSVSNGKVFRSDNNGSSWVDSGTGLTSNVAVLKSDSSRVLALTTGGQNTPWGIFQTLDNGANWTEIPTVSVSLSVSAIGSTTNKIYAGTNLGKLFYTNNNGNSWQDISGTLPVVQINTIMAIGNYIFVGTDGQGMYRSNDNGSSWTASGSTSTIVKDIQEQNGALYAATWGGGVFVSNDTGASWTAYNAGLANLFVRSLASEGVKLYAGTDTGAYSYLLTETGVSEKEQTVIKLYPNPSSGIIYISVPANQKKSIIINNVSGELIYHSENYFQSNLTIDLSLQPKGLYFLNLRTEKEMIRRKIVVQ